MNRFALAALTAVLAAGIAGPAAARDRNGGLPPVMISPELADKWILQLSPGSGVVPGYRRPDLGERIGRASGRGGYSERRLVVQAPARVSKRSAEPAKAAAALDPIYLPQVVEYETKQAPGTIVIDTKQRFLYLVEKDGKARRYGVGVGREGFGWSGTEKITSKREWPTWTPPAEMRAREKKKGKILPVRMEGGPDNPLGARALYLGSTLYRIHGTNQPWSIGQAVSSGCIRMRNEDVIELYERASVGTRVVVL